MDVDSVEFGLSRLEEEGQRLAPFTPEPVADAVRLQRKEALEEQEWLQRGARGGIAIQHGLQVALGGGDDGGIGLVGLLADLADGERVHVWPAGLLRELVAQRIGEGLMIEHGGVEIAGERRLLLGGLLRVEAQLLPDWRGHAGIADRFGQGRASVGHVFLHRVPSDPV